MKIGVLLSSYNSEEYIDECLKPWFELRETMDITIGCNSGMYKDYLNFGFTPKNKPTLHKLVNYDLDFLIATGSKSLLGENDSKNSILHVLKNKCDVVWIVDSDEFYTKEEILSIVKYIEETPQYDWYTVNFKNYTFEKNLWVDGFNPPRIFRTDRNGGINEFYFDNHISYNDGDIFENKPSNSIPRNIAWVKHYSWLTDDPRTNEKISYQNMRFDGGCSLGFVNGKLNFINEFYENRGLEPPIIHETIEEVSNEFTFTFVRRENKFYIQNIKNFKSINVRIYDGQNGNLIYDTHLDIVPDTNYFIYPSSIIFNDLLDFKKFRVEVIENNKIIHNEFLHIKYE